MRLYPKSLYRIYREKEANDETDPGRTDEDLILDDEIYRTCPICTRVMGGQKSLEVHVGTHELLKAKCEVSNCGWAFRRFGELRKHYSNHHELVVTIDDKGTILFLGTIWDNIKKECPICKRPFFGKFDHDHVRMHDKLKFQCLEPNCGWMFSAFPKFTNHYVGHHKLKLSPVADPGFSPGGCANSQNCYYFSNFCRKLHENERIWSPGGGGARPWRHPLDPPMVSVC